MIWSDRNSLWKQLQYHSMRKYIDLQPKIPWMVRFCNCCKEMPAFQSEKILSQIWIVVIASMSLIWSWPGPRCIKLTIDGNFAINGNYHGNRAQQPIKIKVSMAVTIDGKVTINGKFYATRPRPLLHFEAENTTQFCFLFVRLLRNSFRVILHLTLHDIVSSFQKWITFISHQ